MPLESTEPRLPLSEFGCLRFSVLQTETLACSLGHPARKPFTTSDTPRGGASTGNTPGHIQPTPIIPVSGCRTPSASSDVSSFSPWSGFHCCPVGTQGARRSRRAGGKIQGAKKHCRRLLVCAQLQVNMMSYTLKSQIMIRCIAKYDVLQDIYRNNVFLYISHNLAWSADLSSRFDE